MPNPNPTDTKPNVATWIITFAALGFCIIGAPAIVEAEFQAIRAAVLP